MVRDWETVLRVWGRAPGEAEQTKMENTEARIKEAIAASRALSEHDIQVKAQGSYKNLTHIPRESDVDIRVVCRDVFFSDLNFADPNVKTDTAARAALRKRFGIIDSDYTFDQFRDDVGAALVARFGPPPAVKPGDKAFSVHETRSLVEADVVAALVHRRYRADGTWQEGVEFRTRKGKKIINWPDQQFDNGVEKNKATHERYKAMVRALKNCRAEMEDEGKPEAEPISSFLIECLVWNVPNDRLDHTKSYHENMQSLLSFLIINTKTEATCSEWGEESELKYLFRPSQPWTREEARAFCLAAFIHMGMAD
jgi:hypothetical protein